MVLHALHDFTLRYSNFPLIPLNVAQDIVLLGFAWVLLRGMRRSETDDVGSAVAHPVNI
ncbi:hypothetical protein GCM10010841_32350 [Deinococcus aerophilus]|uniref:Uncharacterized protein n=2 Tax=Deinococcus aerophilus TaxID=522488 RepID=A0ABQ2H0Z2_9DEIO|nr:hypothetical protein GCM10010841_32350 [Deinococcus aerophilus]